MLAQNYSGYNRFVSRRPHSLGMARIGVSHSFAGSQIPSVTCTAYVAGTQPSVAFK